MASTLNTSQVHILQTLRKSDDGLTRAQLASKCPEGTAVTPANLGTAETSDNHVDSLKSLGLVKLISSRGAGLTEEDERDLIVWRITPKGEKLATSIKAKGVSARGVSIPPKVLDPIIKRMRPLRTYGLNQWTDADVLELRGHLPEEYQSVTVDTLRTKIVGRRQAGAFADPTERPRKAARASLAAFGPNGSIQAGLLPAKVVADLEKFINAKS